MSVTHHPSESVTRVGLGNAQFNGSLFSIEHGSAIDLPLSDVEKPTSLADRLPDRLPEHEHPIDGGIRAWCTLAGAWFAIFATFGYTNAFGVYQDIFTRADAGSASQVSWIGSTQIFLMIAMGIISGKLLDAGHFRVTTLVGSIIYAVSLFMLSLVHLDKYYQIFLAEGLGMGIGSGLIYTPALAVQAHHWRSRRALAMGIVMTGSAIGGIVFPIMLNQLIPKDGFASGVRSSAYVVLGALVVANILMSPNPAKNNNKPKPDVAGMLREPAFMLVNLSGLMLFLGAFFPYFYIQLLAILKGVDRDVAFYALAMMNGSSIIGRVFPNFLADKIGPVNCLIPACLGCGAFILTLFAVKDTATVVVTACLYGFVSGALMSLTTPTIASLAKDNSEMGVRVGLSTFIISFGALFGNPINGALLGHDFPWYKALVFSSSVCFAGTTVLLVARHILARQKGTNYL